MRFQSLTGFPGHSDNSLTGLTIYTATVSIPNGLPRPFRRQSASNGCGSIRKFQSLTGFPGHSDFTGEKNAQNPLMFQSLTGFPGHSDFNYRIVQQGFKMFQSLTGFPGHSDNEG